MANECQMQPLYHLHFQNQHNQTCQFVWAAASPAQQCSVQILPPVGGPNDDAALAAVATAAIAAAVGVVAVVEAVDFAEQYAQ